MVLKHVPTTIYYQGKDYEGGILQEVPEELAKLIDEYNEKNKKELERLEELSYIAVSADTVSANDPNFEPPEEEIIQGQQEPDKIQSPPKRPRKPTEE